MAEAIRVRRIVEFNGLPGSGKSTIAASLKKQIEEKCCQNVLFEYYKYDLFRHPRSLFLSPFYYNKIWKIREFSKTFKTPPHLAYSLTPIMYNRMYDQFLNNKNDNDILLIDEGIVQMLVSLAFQYELQNIEELNKILGLFHLNRYPLLIVNCICEPGVTEKRLLQRQPQGCRLEGMDNTELKDTIHVQEHNFDIIRSSIMKEYPSLDVINVDTNQLPDYNAEKIFKTLFG